MSETNLNDAWYDFAGAFVHKKNESTLRWQALTSDEQEIAALWLLEADMYNGGFIQFFCNWGEEAYLYAVRALQAIGAERALELVVSGYACIERLEQDDRLTQLWDIPKFLTTEEEARLDELDQRFWEDPDGIAETAYRYYAVKLGIPAP
ncbi:DMP19 family protein [Paenibacillus sanfengchensis]|uniref:DMP19 family protein n=1 Tax=Paenibacillus sanfengchensis TaxID=3119819 RepID=UPI002FE150A2